jgi:hypothetical protein
MTKNTPPSLRTSESQVRFGCGFLMGLLLPFLLGFFWEVTTLGWGIIVVCMISAVVCSFLSRRYGDLFWKLLIKFWHF